MVKYSKKNNPAFFLRVPMLAPPNYGGLYGSERRKARKISAQVLITLPAVTSSTSFGRLLLASSKEYGGYSIRLRNIFEPSASIS